MALAGYSGKPLATKLGITAATRILLVNAPPDYSSLLEMDISTLLCRKNEVPGLVHLFAVNNKSFEKGMAALAPVWNKNTSVVIWVSWYKKSSGMASDITEDIIRKYALLHGLVDVKVCAVNDLWSALKLVVPVAKRSIK